ncbi:hypothetical protein CRI94_07630 [Longibacter salinarum]|uniref:DUF5723 domain-containing protein n=1 Tax=Longibacter salinarum TaxID=1850348 RepID=A0A2A8CZT9_9BACT|nr:hypothetical protein CRI94_07630 [Longibacter salinarum]
MVAQPVFAQSDEPVVTNRTLSYLGLSVTNDPGQYALGGGTVALRGRPGAVDVNPAAIGENETVQVGVDVGGNPVLQSDFIFDQTLTSPFVTVKSGRWAAGLQFLQFSYGRFQRRAPNGDVVGSYDKHHRTVKAVGAYEVSQTWTVGTALGYSTENFITFQETDDARSVTIDLGIHGRWERSLGNGGQLRPSIGASLTDFGSNSQITDRTDIATPTRLHLGGALAYESGSTWKGRARFKLLGHVAMSKQMVRIESGRNGRDVAGPFAALVETWRPSDGSSQPDPNGGIIRSSIGVWGQIEKHMGVEVKAFDIASLRIGKNFVSDQFSSSETVVGVGLNFVYVRLDYGTAIASSSEYREDLSFLRITASIPLDGTFDHHWW